MSTRDERAADAVLAEAATMATATRVLDEHAAEVSTERLDAVLMLIDILVAARRIESDDAVWLLPAMGYSADGLQTEDEDSEE